MYLLYRTASVIGWKWPCHCLIIISLCERVRISAQDIVNRLPVLPISSITKDTINTRMYKATVLRLNKKCSEFSCVIRLSYYFCSTVSAAEQPQPDAKQQGRSTKMKMHQTAQ